MRSFIWFSAIFVMFFSGAEGDNPYDTSSMNKEVKHANYTQLKNTGKHRSYLSLRGDAVFDLYFATPQRGVMGEYETLPDTLILKPRFEYMVGGEVKDVDTTSLNVLTITRYFRANWIVGDGVEVPYIEDIFDITDITDYSGYPMPD